MRSACATLAATLLLVSSGLACKGRPEAHPSEPGLEQAPVDETPSTKGAEAKPEPPAPTAAPEPQLDLPEIAGVAYLEVLTGGAQADARLPMIVALHGNGAFPRLMEYALLDDPGNSRHPSEPFEARARVIFLRGTEIISDAGHARWFSVTANEALESPEQLVELSAQISARSERVADAIAALVEAKPTLGKPIVTGHSQGAILTFGLALAHPELFEAAFPVAGWLPRPLWPKQPASAGQRELTIVALHGADDTVVSFEESKLAVDELEQLGYAIALHSYPGVRHALTPMLRELRGLLASSVRAKH